MSLGKLIDSKIGYDNFFLIGMLIVMALLSFAYFRMDSMIPVFNNMCVHNYSINETCSCVSTKLNSVNGLMKNGTFGNFGNLSSIRIIP